MLEIFDFYADEGGDVDTCVPEMATQSAWLGHVTGSALANSTRHRCLRPISSPPCLPLKFPSVAPQTPHELPNHCWPTPQARDSSTVVIPTSRTTRATAYSRVPVRIHTLAGDTDYTIYKSH